ncbi:MAG: ParA family protein [Chloroflexota bacterium]|nr:ParA family protein [Chloroflexota bacterium]
MEQEVPLKVAAQHFGVKLDRLRRAAWDGRLSARLLGNQYVVTLAAVERFLSTSGREQPIPPPVLSASGETMARIIAIAVPKGGTGKTTTTLNLGAALAEQGKRVLLVDFDPQGSLTLALGVRPDELEHTIHSAISYFLATYEPRLDLAIQSTTAGVDLVPATIRLNLANAELTVAPRGEVVLRELLAPLSHRYDVILIDTLPYLGILVENALAAAHEVLIPLQTEYLSTESVALMLRQIQFVRKSKLNPNLGISGILMTQVDSRTVLSRQFIEYARKEFGAQVPVFETVIKRTVSFPESQARRQSILQYAPNDPGARAYRALAEEVWHAAQ